MKPKQLMVPAKWKREASGLALCVLGQPIGRVYRNGPRDYSVGLKKDPFSATQWLGSSRTLLAAKAEVEKKLEARKV